MSLLALPNSPLERIKALCVGKGVDLSLGEIAKWMQDLGFGGWRGSLARMTQASRGARADAGECDSISVLARLALILTTTLGFTYTEQDLIQHKTVKKSKEVLLHQRWDWKLKKEKEMEVYYYSCSASHSRV